MDLSTSRRLFSHAAVLFFVAFLGACVGGKTLKRVNPPQLTIQSLELQSGRHIVLDLRIQNHSDVVMHFDAITVDLELASYPATQIELKTNRDVTPHSAEIVQYKFQPSDQIAQLFRRALDSGITYRLIGTIESSEPHKQFDIETSSRLNPVPGKPGEFR